MKRKPNLDGKKVIRVLTEAELTQVNGGVAQDGGLKKATKRKA